MPWAKLKPIYNPSVRSLCTRRYPGHPRGCPNHGKRPTCPPQAPHLGRIIDLGRDVWAVWNCFDLAGHVARMRGRHPHWSERQLRNCLYWQGTARKRLRAEVRTVLLMQFHQFGAQVLYCPEACGADVTGTMVRIGIALEWPPETFAYQVALVGYPVKES